MNEPASKSDDKGLRGWELVGAVALSVILGVAYVWWKQIKHNWLADHGYLPEGMRDYWIVFAVVWVVFIAWAAITRFRE